MDIFNSTREFLNYYLKFLHREPLDNNNIGKIYNHIQILIAYLDRDLELFKEALIKPDYDSDYNQFFRIALLHKHLSKTNKCENYNTFNFSLCYLLVKLQPSNNIDDLGNLEGNFKDYLEELLLPRIEKDEKMFNDLNQGFLNKINSTFHSSTKEKCGCNITFKLLNILIEFFENQIFQLKETFHNNFTNYFLRIRNEY